jgi:hypothetical protein
MQRTLALAAAITLAALLLPAAISSSARSAASSQARIALLERPAGFGDQLPPAVAKLVDVQEVDASTVRLGATTDSAQYFVAQGTRGLCLIRVDDPVQPNFTTTCASTLIAGGVYLGTLDRAAGSMQVADIVPDDVTGASVDGSPAPVANNMLVTGDVPLAASVRVTAAAGAQRVPITIGPSTPVAGLARDLSGRVR